MVNFPQYLPPLAGPQQPGLDQWLMQQMQAPQQAAAGQPTPTPPQLQQGFGQSMFNAGQNMLGFGRPAQQQGMPMNILPPMQQGNPDQAFGAMPQGGQGGIGASLFKMMFL